ncbi:hypothetical protein DFH09DRAFT_1313152 [Mycena vulgaris]|nr:hypothetical protein DFH09DRAFT_1313152 [Mycena vulgaris]
MVWIDGALNPNEIKAKALENGGNKEFQARLIAFLDDTISTAVPPDPAPDLKTPLSHLHPCSTRGPGPGIDPDVAVDAEAHDLHNLVERCQRHRHTDTCYKYWKAPDPHECRFDLDPSNERPISVFDEETGEFHLRCLDGLVNNFNLTMMKAIRCNMGTKFIGSGPAAKAILYYITDYITKSQLKAHVAYAALELAVNKLKEFDPVEDDLESRARKLLQKCAHSLISKQELSAQQVVSYLMDFEDHFTSHDYVNLYWTSLEGLINAEDPSPECYPIRETKRTDDSTASAESTDVAAPNAPALAVLDLVDEPADDAANEPDEVPFIEDSDLITFKLTQSGTAIPTANQACDYQCRGDLLQNVNVWDFVAQTDKERIKNKPRATDEDLDMLVDDPDADDQKVALPDDPEVHFASDFPANEEGDVDDPVWTCDNILDCSGKPLPRVDFLESLYP